MSDRRGRSTTGTGPATRRDERTRRRGALTWVVAAAAVLVIVAVAVFAVLHHDTDAPRPPATPTGDGRTVTELSAPSPAAYRARCVVPGADLVARQSVAFEGEATTVAPRAVSFTPTRWYAGHRTDLVRVRAPTADLQRFVGSVGFREGGRYLVSASHGEVTLCGLTGPATPRLRALYARAFGD